MSNIPSTGPYADLPPRRDDIKFDGLNEEAVEALAENRLIVLNGFFDDEQAEGIRTSVKSLLVAHAPIRAFRKLLDQVVDDSDSLPRFLQRRPMQVLLGRSAVFGASTKAAIQQVIAVNEELYGFPPIQELYGSTVHELTHGLLNLTHRGSWFSRHQDSQGVRGFGFACQTSHTLWHVEPSATHPEQEDYTFETNAGDLVVVGERTADLPPGTIIARGAGFEDFAIDGSHVHTGLNLDPNRARYTLNLFSTEYVER